MAQDVGEISQRVAQLDTEVGGLKSDVQEVRKELGNFADKMDRNLGRLFDRVEATGKKETPWGVILTGLGIMSAGGIGLSGLFLTLILALSAWANSYFGQRIEAAQEVGNQALQHQTTATNKVDVLKEKVSTLEAQRDSSNVDRARLQSQLDAVTAKLDAAREHELLELREKVLARPQPAGG
jgi:septal ring factor EnvC (AmiA/AmiB activator)